MFNHLLIGAIAATTLSAGTAQAFGSSAQCYQAAATSCRDAAEPLKCRKQMQDVCTELSRALLLPAVQGVRLVPGPRPTDPYRVFVNGQRFSTFVLKTQPGGTDEDPLKGIDRRTFDPSQVIR